MVVKGKKFVKWTESEINILRDRYKEMPNKEILKLLPYKTTRTINRKANRMGLRKNYEPSKFLRFEIDNKEIRKLRDKGLTIKRIGKIFGCSPELVYKRYKEMGINGISPKRDIVLLDNKMIKEMYLKNYSASKISRILKANTSTIIRRLENLGIKRESRNHKEPLTKEQISNIINLYIKGNSTYEIEEKTGICYIRVFHTLKRNGIKLRSKEESNKLNWEKNGEKRSELMSQKGRERFLDNKFLEKYKESINRKPNRPEGIMIEIIKENNLPFNYVGDGQVWIGGFNPDFLSKNPKHIIEVFGDYWHNKNQKMLDRDIRRKKAYSKLGYKTLIIWENELKNKTNVLNKVRSFLDEK